jgi:F-type H+-transporting ATPase subunit epsilon
MSNLIVELVTPDGAVFTGPALGVQAPAVDGLFEVLFNHAPMVALLGKGQITLTLPDRTRQSWAVEGGVLEVNSNQVIVAADTLTA